MITDNTAKWRVKKVTEFIGNSLPIGHFYQTISPTVPAGSLPLFGGTYSRTLYADLWTWIQQSGLLITESAWQSKATANEGNVPFFSQGDGSTTFRVPSMKCWVKGANGVEEVGSYLKAGLPNITGTAGYFNALVGYEYSGAMYEYDQKYTADSDNGATYARKIGFDASKANAIYGNSDTVQPKSIVGMWCVVAYGTASNVGNADVGNVMQAVEQVQTNFEGLKNQIANISLVPDYSAGVLKTSGTQYTAETDGYIMAQCFRNAQTGSETLKVIINDTELPFQPLSTDYGRSQIYLPIKKSDTYKITANDKIYFFPMRA